MEPKDVNGVLVAEVPNILLQSEQKICVFLVDVNESYVETVTHMVLPVIPRPKPTDYVYTETEILSWQALEARVIAFMDEINEARVSGDLKGDKGEKGDPGEQGPKGEKGEPGPAGEKGDPGAPGADGFSPTVQVQDITGGHRVTVTDKNGSKSFNVMDGKDGDSGGEGEGAQELFIVNAVEDDATTPLTYYADKTVDEILAAVNSGKMPVCYYNMSGTPVVLLPVFSVDGAVIFSNTVILPDPEDGLNMHVCLIISDSGVSCFYTQIATRDDIPSAVEAALEQAKASGAFDGAPGKDGADGAPGKDGASGKDGKDGVSVTHSWNGTTLTVTSASGTSSANLKGDKGDKGDTGAQGEKGDQGDKGDKGDKGDTGATGADGAPGKDGANGKDGKDGVSVTHSWNGTTLTVTSASGTSSANLKGDKGDKGDTGAQGEKGDKGDKGDTGGTGATGFRGFSVLRITTAPSSYTTETGGFTPAYRVALSTVKSQSKATEVVVGDTVVYSYYTYPVGYVDSSYVYLGTRVSIRGSAGAAGETPEKGTDYWTEADKTEMVNATKAALPTLTVTGVDASGVSHSWTVYGVAQ